MGEQGRPLRALLFERVMQRIYAYFVRLLHDATEVEDCLQNTLLRLETSLRDGVYNPQHSFNRWMWLKAHSVYVDHLRQAQRRPVALDEQPAGLPSRELAQTEARLDAEVVLQRLRSELEGLDLEAFVLRFQEGMSLPEIAQLQGCSTKTVRRRLKTADTVAQRLLGSGQP